jgi:anti-sigma regulatory factor (Ser/Thr protein kinase)
LNTLANRPQGEVGASDSAAKLANLVRLQLQHAVDGVRDGLKVYESLRNLNEVIGTQYSDRVLYELIQNAHDAHSALEHGKIAVKLVVQSPESGVLYVANGGSGFTFENVEAVRNLAISSKEVGEGIGNKGLGFRSIEALTDDVRIYSKQNDARSGRFDGFCFRFASRPEIETLLEGVSNSATIRAQVADTIPRYLVSVPLLDQPPEISAFAQAGYATVVALPLTTASAVELATAQAQALTGLTVPLLLFLDRIAEVRLDLELPGRPPNRQRTPRREWSFQRWSPQVPHTIRQARVFSERVVCS